MSSVKETLVLSIVVVFTLWLGLECYSRVLHNEIASLKDSLPRKTFQYTLSYWVSKLPLIGRITSPPCYEEELWAYTSSLGLLRFVPFVGTVLKVHEQLIVRYMLECHACKGCEPSSLHMVGLICPTVSLFLYLIGQKLISWWSEPASSKEKEEKEVDNTDGHQCFSNARIPSFHLAILSKFYTTNKLLAETIKLLEDEYVNIKVRTKNESDLCVLTNYISKNLGALKTKRR